MYMDCVFPLKSVCFLITILSQLLDGCHCPLDEVFSGEMRVCFAMVGWACVSVRWTWFVYPHHGQQLRT